MSTGAYVSSSTLYQYDDAGTQNWTKASLLYCVADSSGNVYAATSTGTVKKYDVDGNELWSRSYHTKTIYGLAVDAAGNVAFCGAPGAAPNYITHGVYDSSGSLVWNASHLGTLQCVAMDSSGNSYFGGQVISSVSIRAYAPDGTPLWTANHTTTVYGIAVDASSNVYIGGNRAVSGYTHRKYNASGTEQWQKDHGTFSTIYGCCVDPAGDIYFCGTLTSSVTTRKYNPDGTLVWSRNYNGTTCFALAVDGSGNAYVGSTGTNSFRKYNASGTEQWYKAIGVCHSVWLFSTAVVSDAPGLPIPLALGIPSSNFFVEAPGLPLGIALGLPSSSSLAPIDVFTKPPGQTVYRALVTGDSDPLEVPLASFQCRRRRGDSTWLTVSIPTYSAALKAALLARFGAGAEVLITAGLRYADGTEISGPFLRATLTEVKPEREARNGSIALVARVIPTPYSLSSRTLAGVAERGKDRSGRRTARCCVIDPLLRPGDTVDDGVQSWVAGAILYLVAPALSYMLVTEDS